MWQWKWLQLPASQNRIPQKPFELLKRRSISFAFVTFLFGVGRISKCLSVHPTVFQSACLSVDSSAPAGSAFNLVWIFNNHSRCTNVINKKEGPLFFKVLMIPIWKALLWVYCLQIIIIVVILILNDDCTFDTLEISLMLGFWRVCFCLEELKSQLSHSLVHWIAREVIHFFALAKRDKYGFVSSLRSRQNVAKTV